MDGQSIREFIGEVKRMGAHMTRVKAPQDYQIVYQEIQKHLFNVGSVELTVGTDFLSGIVDLFEVALF